MAIDRDSTPYQGILLDCSRDLKKLSYIAVVVRRRNALILAPKVEFRDGNHAGREEG